MRTLKIIEHITLDGVIQNSPDGGDFPYSDWGAPYRSPAGRDALLAARGFTTIRFTNDDVRDNMDGVLTALLVRLRELPDRWPGSTAGPTPSPPLKGRG